MPAPKTRDQRSRSYTIVINNYTDDDKKRIDDYCSANPEVYLIYGHEIAPTTGTPHLQGYVHLPKPQTMVTVHKWLPRAGLKVCKGNAAQNTTYASKDATDIVTYGTPPKSQQQVQKDKASRFIELAKLGDFATIEVEMPGKYAQMYRTMHQIHTDFMVKPADLDAVCGIWIFGESGSGKTTAARTEYGAYYSKPANKWWDGYQGEDTVIIEDLDPNHKCLGHHLKLWTDKWSFPAEVKGGMRCLRPKRVIITSQYSIDEIWPEEQATIEALTRRCKLIHMRKPETLTYPPEEFRVNKNKFY